MRKYTTINKNGTINHEDNGQFAITTASQKQQHQAERAQRAEQLKVEMSDFASRMGINEDDLAGLFA